LLLRCTQVMFKIINGRQDSLIVSHEAEDRVEKISEPRV